MNEQNQKNSNFVSLELIKQNLKERHDAEFIRTKHFCLSCTFNAIGLDVVVGITHPFVYIRLLNLELRFY
jgi:hypothetical protein